MRKSAMLIAWLWACSGSPSPANGGPRPGPSNTGGRVSADGPGSGGSATSGRLPDGGADSGGASGPMAAAGGAMAGGAGGMGGGLPAADAGMATTGDSGAQPTIGPPGACLEGITGYTEAGPFTFARALSESVNVWVPDVPPGCKLPVVHLAVGTGATCSAYLGVLERLASHGFLATCYEHAGPDDGTHCLTALTAVFDAYPDLADRRIGSTGQETGGAVALYCLGLAEQTWGSSAIYAGHVVAPASGFGGGVTDWRGRYGQIESPVFLMSCSDDVLVSASWVRTGYDALTSEKHWYEATGAPHIPVPVSWWQESAIAFFRWKLLGDEAAGDYLATLPDTDRWSLQAQDLGP